MRFAIVARNWATGEDLGQVAETATAQDALAALDRLAAEHPACVVLTVIAGGVPVIERDGTRPQDGDRVA